MHSTNHPRWMAARTALAAEKSAMEVFAALLGVETWDEVRAKLHEQSEPDITMYLRGGVVYVRKATPDTSVEQLYEDLRDAANRALPVDEAMATINGRLRRELDTAEARNREIDALIALWEKDGGPDTGGDALHELKQVHQGHKRKDQQ